MKRFLSLVLTLVMVMSLVTVSAGAKDFTDNDTITYDEAVAVVSEIGVVDGYTDGKFNPTNTLTRQAAAKIICNLKLGPTTAAELHADTAPYRDVPANNEFAGYIAYCQKEGIISGYADGSFRPGGTLTGYAFMKMLLGALGYDAGLEGYVGANWSINVAKQAIHIGLNKGLEGEFNGIKAVNREEACLYAFNTLQADLVEYGQRLTTNINGTEVTLSAGGAKSREWQSQQSRTNNIREDDIIQFAEEYFSKLVKTPDDDKFMRPAHTWVYDKKIQIGTWLDKDKLLETYTKGVTGRDLYDLLGSATIRDFDLEVYVDGHVANNTTGTTTTQYEAQYKYDGVDEEITSAEMKRSNTDDLGITGRGVLTEVFIDKDKELITITSIHTWLAQATTSYNEAKETASVKVYLYYTPLKNGSLSLTSETKTVALDDVPEVADVSTDDFYLVTMSDKDTTKLEVVEMSEPEILEQSTITKFSLSTEYSKGQEKGNKYPKELTTGGNDYKNSNRACYDVDTLDQYDNDLLTSNTYNVYLDKYGYFIGIDLFEGTKQYVFVTGYDMRNSNLSIQTASAAGIFLDGTMQNMTVNVKDTNTNIENMVQKKVHTGENAVLTDNEYANANAYYQKWGTNKSDGVYLLNRWYTYTVTESGVYTLKPCVDKNGVAMMLASKTDDTTDSSDSGSELKMNCSKLRLDGVVDSGEGRDGDLLIGETMQYTMGSTTGDNAAPVLTSARAYGEDESVFITVDVDQVSASAGGQVSAKKLDITKAITDVNGVYTGVQDVDLITKTSNRVQGRYYVNNADTGDIGDTATVDNDVHGAGDKNGHWVAVGGASTDSYVGENAYAVFDKNHFIIGAVILGEAEGNNATKAYILDPVKYERYENGTYYWQFEAVINGVIVTQEAESKFSSTIDTMRENQYEVVELRYKAADSEVVTDVKEIARTDTVPNPGNDKIYGNPYGEILTTGHKVNDDESIYDVVLTGKSDNPTVTFTGVTRPRGSDGTGTPLTENIVGHQAPGKTFTTTDLGTLRLQGRTLYVLDGQHDYGVDFVRDAKAVVRQREGFYTDAARTIEDPSTDWKDREYASVEEAINSLGDYDITTGEKEFRGIITAVLNSQGVAEWIVFYSDTLAETKNNTSVAGATMDVEVRIELPGGKSEFYEIRKVTRPTDGTNIISVEAPDLSAKGLYPDRDYDYVRWGKYDERPIVTFVYSEDGNPSGSDKVVIRVMYTTDYDDPGQVGEYENVSVTLDAAGYGKLAEKLLKHIPAGYELDPDATATTTDLGKDIEKSTSAQTKKVLVRAMADTAITGIKLHDEAAVNWAKYGNVPSGVKFDLTYPNGTVENVAQTLKTTAITINEGTATDWQTDGVAEATINGKTCNVPVKIYAEVTTTDAATGWTVTANPEDTKNGTVTLTFEQADASELAEAAIKALTVSDNHSTGATVSFGSVTFVRAGTDSVTAKFTVVATISDLTAATVAIKATVATP